MVLRSCLGELPKPLLKLKHAAQLEAVIDRRCRDLFAVTVKLGTLALNDGPAKFSAALHKRWKKWRR
jgi:hypothetical protein